MNLRILSLSTVAAALRRRALRAALHRTPLRCLTLSTRPRSICSPWSARSLVAACWGCTVSRSAMRPGAWAQLAIVWIASRASASAAADAGLRRALARDPGQAGVLRGVCGGLGLNMIFTRAWATHAGPGMAAALDYCMRGVACRWRFWSAPSPIRCCRRSPACAASSGCAMPSA